MVDLVYLVKTTFMLLFYKVQVYTVGIYKSSWSVGLHISLVVFENAVK